MRRCAATQLVRICSVVVGGGGAAAGFHLPRAAAGRALFAVGDRELTVVANERVKPRGHHEIQFTPKRTFAAAAVRAPPLARRCGGAARLPPSLVRGGPLPAPQGDGDSDVAFLRELVQAQSAQLAAQSAQFSDLANLYVQQEKAVNDLITRQGDVVTRQGDLVTRQGDLVTRQGDVVMRLGDLDARQAAVEKKLAAVDADMQKLLLLLPQLEQYVYELLREKGDVSVRGALNLLLDHITVGPAAQEVQLAAYFSGGIGAEVLKRCNASRTVVSDNGGKPHTPATLARKLLKIMRQLQQDARDGGPDAEYARKGDGILLRRIGLSETEELMLYTMFAEHHYPVRRSAEAAEAAEAEALAEADAASVRADEPSPRRSRARRAL